MRNAAARPVRRSGRSGTASFHDVLIAASRSASKDAAPARGTDGGAKLRELLEAAARWFASAAPFPQGAPAIRRIAVGLLALWLASAAPALCQPPEPASIAPRAVLPLEVSVAKLLRLRVPAATVFVGDPTVADVQLPSDTSIFMWGKKPGRTTFFALSRSGAVVLSYTIEVRYGEAELAARIKAEAGDLPVRLAYTPGGAVLSGTVPNAGAAERIATLASGWVGPGQALINQLRVTGSTQVNLRVRVAEVSRAVTRSLGFNWSSVFQVGSFAIGLETGQLAGALVGAGQNTLTGIVSTRRVNAAATLDAMAMEGLVTLLAEPNLTTSSGVAATFLAGGSIPIPVPQALGVSSVQYQPYGVSVAFTPTVLSSGMISMKVRPEVSAIDQANAVSLGAGTVPAFTTRNAETTVELASGQSFAIAGLIQNNASNNVSKVPWLGDIPVLGALFRSNNFQRNQTELVIVVTPYLVTPVAAGTRIALPTDNVGFPSDLERLLYSRVAAQRGVPFDPERMPRLHGAAGFLFE